jgi:hypothetical protein
MYSIFLAIMFLITNYTAATSLLVTNLAGCSQLVPRAYFSVGFLHAIPDCITMGDLEPPEKANAAIDITKEVTWSATPTEKEQEFIENCKVPARYKLSPHVSVKQAVLKETFKRFKITDPTFLIVFKIDPESIFRKAEDFDKLTPNDLKRLFPADLIRLNTHFLQLYSIRPSHSSPQTRLLRLIL